MQLPQTVVGADGSAPAGVAVEQAAREAACHGSSLRIVHTVNWVPPPGFASVLSEAGEKALREGGERVLAEAETAARSVAPEVEVGTTLSMGDPRTVLTELSREALMTVVGSNGTSGIASGLLGSVARHLVTHAEGPVMVAREPSASSAPVVVGLDGSAEAEAATAFAFAEAAACAEPLLALHAWSEWSVPPSPPDDPSLRYARAPGQLKEGEERLLAQALSGWCERYPQVSVERRTVRERARQALIEASRSARLLVLGRRGKGGFAGLRLGSVSNAAVQHAHCSVVVVHGRRTDPKAGGPGPLLARPAV
ncbi:universal stress protein [Streptomyces smyrnaeus]|uniref:universal stress protein n=1 Tax=Streptomyces TaxID=1883 RepID=UPI000C1A3857|nr:universal stress protein [Streptomyces sp. B15]MBQ1120638.1 universal stress protein [Streptomyces sp. B15]MBQ1157444.1 universal stress protein [Streptomyces sp. A73]